MNCTRSFTRPYSFMVTWTVRQSSNDTCGLGFRMSVFAYLPYTASHSRILQMTWRRAALSLFLKSRGLPSSSRRMSASICRIDRSIFPRPDFGCDLLVMALALATPTYGVEQLSSNARIGDAEDVSARKPQGRTAYPQAEARGPCPPRPGVGCSSLRRIALASTTPSDLGKHRHNIAWRPNHRAPPLHQRRLADTQHTPRGNHNILNIIVHDAKHWREFIIGAHLPQIIATNLDRSSVYGPAHSAGSAER